VKFETPKSIRFEYKDFTSFESNKQIIIENKNLNPNNCFSPKVANIISPLNVMNNLNSTNCFSPKECFAGNNISPLNITPTRVGRHEWLMKERMI
jgi:hypothetical protein